MSHKPKHKRAVRLKQQAQAAARVKRASIPSHLRPAPDHPDQPTHPTHPLYKAATVRTDKQVVVSLKPGTVLPTEAQPPTPQRATYTCALKHGMFTVPKVDAVTGEESELKVRVRWLVLSRHGVIDGQPDHTRVWLTKRTATGTRVYDPVRKVHIISADHTFEYSYSLADSHDPDCKLGDWVKQPNPHRSSNAMTHSEVLLYLAARIGVTPALHALQGLHGDL